MSFEASVEHEGKSYTATVTPKHGSWDFGLKVGADGVPEQTGTWNPVEYTCEGIEPEALSEAVDDLLSDKFAELWTVEVAAFEAGEGDVPPDRVDRLGGSPIGVSLQRWPSLNGEPMAHVITVAREHFDASIDLPENVVAAALFLWNPQDNEAFEPDTGASKVLLLTADDIAKGETTERPEGYDADWELPAAPLVVTRVKDVLDEVSDDHAGWPMNWVQADEGEEEGRGAFLFQFTEDLIDINLGDLGTMFVFSNLAWWQCG